MDPQEAINKIKLGVHSQTRSKSGEESVTLAHHVMMRKYGWIPLDEFNKLPLPTFWSLMGLLQQEAEEEEKAMRKSGRKR